MPMLKVWWPSDLPIISDQFIRVVQPIHVAFTLLNENAGTTGARPANEGTTLFASVISRGGGDPVSKFHPSYCLVTLIRFSSCP